MIREATLQDLYEVSALEALCFPKAEAASEEALKQRIKTFPESFLVMELDGKIVGMINGCICDQRTIHDDLYDTISNHNPNGAYQAVFGLDVHPDYQHQGYAKALMYALIQQTQRKNKKGMILTCKKHLIEFYESFGYQNMGISKSKHGGVVWYDMLLEFS